MIRKNGLNMSKKTQLNKNTKNNDSMEIIEHENQQYVTVTDYLVSNTLGFSTQISKNNNFQTHNHVNYEIFYVLSGEIYHTFNGNKELIKTGDCFLLSPNDRHSFKSITQSINRDIIISTELFKSILALFPHCNNSIKELTKKTHVKFSISEIMELENLVRSFSFENNINKKRCTCVSIVLKIFSKFFSNDSNDQINYKIPPIVKTIRDRLNSANFLKEGTSAVFKSLNYTHSYVCNTFKKHMNMTISEYINEIRITHIAYYLKTSDYSLSQIADMVGIETVSYMNKIFKKKFHITPTQYRRQEY